MALQPHKSGCKVCGEPTKGGARGLCQKHYRRFMQKLDAFKDAKEREAFEAACLADGWITPKSKGGRKPEDDDPFKEIADSVTKATQRAAEAKERYETGKPAKKKRTTKKKSN